MAKQEKPQDPAASKKKLDDASHKGHRLRVKEKFLQKGLDPFYPHEVLELLLFFAVPYKDTNPLAHRLIEQFGSLSGVFDAPVEDLEKVLGSTRHVATLCKLIPEMARVYLDDKQSKEVLLEDTESIGNWLIRKFIGRKNEVVILTLTDSQYRIVFCDVVSEGDLDSVALPVRRIMELVVRYHAAHVVLAHNHPSGNSLPSRGDIQATRELCRALASLHMSLEDHFIITENQYLSLAEQGLLEHILSAFD